MKYARILGMLGALTLLMQASAFGQQFTSVSASVVTSGVDTGELQISWQETGLTYPSNVTYTFMADLTVTYACVVSSTLAVDQSPISGTQSRSASLPVSRKGTISQKALLQLLSGSGQPCPSGETQVLDTVQWSWDTSLVCDDTNQTCLQSIAGGNASMSFCNLSRPKNCPPAN
jgi:hypothetical protein